MKNFLVKAENSGPREKVFKRCKYELTLKLKTATDNIQLFSFTLC